MEYLINKCVSLKYVVYLLGWLWSLLNIVVRLVGIIE